jgi:hypothetical protein
MTGVGVNNHLMFQARLVEQFVKLLYGAHWNRLIYLAKEAEYRRSPSPSSARSP